MVDGTPGIGGSEWLQEGYFIPDFMVQADDFSNVNPWSSSSLLLVRVTREIWYDYASYQLTNSTARSMSSAII